MTDKIVIKGAREHNLKNVDCEIPKNKLVVFTGLSGSGKSSMAFDTIYAEGQRRYVESLSSYARQFLGVMDKPDCDQITGLSPAISIDQKTTSHNPRSTVGTVTEIYDYMRLLYARVGHPHCPNCKREISHLTTEQIVDQILGVQTAVGMTRIMILAPVVKGRKGEYSKLLESLKKDGYQRARIDKEVFAISSDLMLIKTNKHDIDVVVDRLSLDKKTAENNRDRLREAVSSALKLSGGEVVLTVVKDSSLEFPEKPKDFEDKLFSQRFACPVCNISLPEIEPRIFSFNTPHGACPTCTGLGYLLKIDKDLIINPDLSILEGGILPIGNETDHDTWFMRMITEVARVYNINLVTPIKNIPQEKLNKILNGTTDLITVKGTNREGKMTQFSERFEGVIPRMERLYKETQSDWSRQNIERFMRNETCPSCQGKRLKNEALSVTIDELNIVQACQLSIIDSLNWFQGLKFNDRDTIISTPILKEIISRLEFLTNVGLDYLTLERSANTLAGGEAQRIRLASQIGSGLTGVLYVLDEPSIGLHQRDNTKLIETLKHLRDIGNSVVVVEHDREMMEDSDYIFDFGPGAGVHGGKIVAQGTVDQIKKDKNSVTGEYLSGKRSIERHVSQGTNALTQDNLILFGCTQNNLKNITVEFPLGKFIAVTGISGSGKSTLVNDILYHAVAAKLHHDHKEKPGKFEEISGTEFLDKVIMIDQSPIGRTPRSNPATYTGLFTPVRELFAQTKEAKERGLKSGQFSFNVKGGRCEACEGEGQLKIEMQFLPDVYVDCEVCQGKRYRPEILDVLYKDKNISQVLDLTIDDALGFFAPIPAIRNKLETLVDVGLGYMRLGQAATTLSGGEAQRVKLATELSKRATGKTLYLLDEPTTGLHFADLQRLLNILQRLSGLGNTVVVIEHNLDLIKNADWIIDLGPEGGDRGGQVVASGTPTEVSQNPNSWTGKYLKEML